MPPSFHATVEHRHTGTHVTMIGVIDEDNELAELLAQLPPGPVIVDLSEVTRINSPGVRDWISWIARLEAQGVQLTFVGCPPPMVSQINLVSNFTGNGVVHSLFLPYFCPKCDDEKRVLVEAAHLEPPPAEPPSQRCEECDAIMDFDELAGSYLSFLNDPRKLGRGARMSMAAVAPSPRMSGLPSPTERTSVLPPPGEPVRASLTPPPPAGPGAPASPPIPDYTRPSQPGLHHASTPGLPPYVPPTLVPPAPLAPPGSPGPPGPPPAPYPAYTAPVSYPALDVPPLPPPPSPLMEPTRRPSSRGTGAGLQLLLMVALVGGIGVLAYLLFAG
jgi:anti-anti-sigma regulatory factor